MPKAQRVRHTLHARSAVSSKNQHLTAADAEASLLAPQLIADLQDDSSIPELAEPSETEPQSLNKKAKKAMKHELFIQRLEASSSPYSKSHERRLKRRAKEQVASGLDDIKAALSAVDVAVPQTIQEALESESAEATASRPRTTQGQIGEGKAAPLSKAQRKRALAMERKRIPMILQNSEFAKNPFQTIRTHAQNTLVKHEVPT